MELYKEILLHLLERETVHVIFPDLKMDLKKQIESECLRALVRIREILADDALCDKECFQKIEEIVCVFEALGSSGGTRHDFG